MPARVNTLSPVRALGVGVAEALLSAKTIPLAISAGAQLSRTGLAGPEAFAALAVFASIASLSIIVPAVALSVGGERVRQPLVGAKQWLLDNVTTILLVMFTLIGADLVGKGLGLFH